MEYSAVIVAAGSGTRMGLGYNKVYYRLKDGRTILETTLSVFQNDPDCRDIIVVTDEEEFHHFVTDIDKVTVCAGGKTRQESVYQGLRHAESEVVMIHDGARPYITRENLDALKKAMETEEAALLCVPCKDTIKKAVDGYIVTTYDRSTLVSAQTPQVFHTQVLKACIEKAAEEGYTGTDDASLVERYTDIKIRTVEGSYANIKVTTPEDVKSES